MFLFLPRWIRHRAARPIENNGNRYTPGQKRCQMCEIFLIWDGLWCRIVVTGSEQNHTT
jgi:hypothetical protein